MSLDPAFSPAVAPQTAVQPPSKLKHRLATLALGRRPLRAWAWYDWASSAVWTTVITAVFPIYFYRVAAGDLPDGAATTRFAVATTTGLIIVALLAPALAMVADAGAVRKKMLAAF